MRQNLGQAMRRRSGVTLIELLVVIGIITTLATLIVAVAPRFGERQRATRGASQVQSWLNLAKQRAMRDRRPVGIRMPGQDSTTTTTPYYVRELQFVEVPDESIGGSVTVPYPVKSGAPNYQNILLMTTAVITQDATALLQAGDVILIPGYDARRILVVGPGQASGGQNAYQITLDKALTPSSTTTTAYRVSRKARPIVGEAVLQLPKDIAIDIDRQATATGGTPNWYRMFPPTANSNLVNPFDILFSPSGQVIGAEGSLGSRICLWVRDVSLNTTGSNVANDYNRTDPTAPPPGSNTLITIYTRTGHITSHPIAITDPTTGANLLTPGTTTWNPFRFTQDGLTSGNGGS